MSEPIMFTIEIHPSEETRFMEDDTALRDQIRAFTESLVKFNTKGPTPSVVVNHFNHKLSDPVVVQLLRDIVGGDPESIEDDKKMMLAIERARELLGFPVVKVKWGRGKAGAK